MKIKNRKTAVLLAGCLAISNVLSVSATNETEVNKKKRGKQLHWICILISDCNAACDNHNVYDAGSKAYDTSASCG